jgi:hypothetical protein
MLSSYLGLAVAEAQTIDASLEGHQWGFCPTFNEFGSHLRNTGKRRRSNGGFQRYASSNDRSRLSG